MLAMVRPRDIAGKTRRRIAAEELAELVAVDAKIKKSSAELKAMVVARGSHLMDLHGVGPVVAARVLATSVTSHGSPTETGSRRGPGQHPWTPPPGSTTGTASPGPGTVG
jgi:transposase